MLNTPSIVGVLEYLEGSSVGYNHIKRDLRVINVTRVASYDYSFDSQRRYTISKSFKLLINAYPILHGVTNGNILSLYQFSFLFYSVLTHPAAAGQRFISLNTGLLRLFKSGFNRSLYVIPKYFSPIIILPWQDKSTIRR